MDEFIKTKKECVLLSPELLGGGRGHNFRCLVEPAKRNTFGEDITHIVLASNKCGEF